MTELTHLATQFGEEIQKISSEEELHRLKSAYLGKKGYVSQLLRNLGQLSPEERPVYGSRTNELKNQIEEECRLLLEKISEQKKEKKIREECVDVTLPGRQFSEGSHHPLTLVMEEVKDLFRDIGFSIYEGPEIETDFYNFEALNIPIHHPARDMQDTFYVNSQFLLRTHTSPVQIHVMKKTKPPIRMIAPGAVYRRDSDISHTPMFHQVEGLVVDSDIRFSDLKGVLAYFLNRFFGQSLKLRFRPSYFPFTEPSAEVDIGCVICGATHGGGKKEKITSCRLCKGTGWLEVMGCGMVHPAVFEKVGYGKYKIKGFAFGMGIERLTMLKFAIPDIRLFYENDLRFLRQFS